jgi:hypothetical protein
MRPLGAPAGQLSAYIEVPFTTADERACRPDGVVQTSRAGRTWTVLIEVKTGAAELDRQQVETYLDVARENSFDAVLTISNQIAPAPGTHPVEVDRRKLKRVALHHLSWAEVLNVAVQQRVHRGVSDPDQAWILGELIRYLEYRGSGALDMTDMGAAWVGVRDALAAGTLRATDKGLPQVVARWEQLLRFAAIRLDRELGAGVHVNLSGKEKADPSLRIAEQSKLLVNEGQLSGSIKIPNAVGPIGVVADLRSGRISVHLDLDAPGHPRSATRVKWLVRQLNDASDALRIDSYAANSKTSASAMLRNLRENPDLLIEDSSRALRSFRVAATSPIGAKRNAFVDSVLGSIDGFYATVVQQIKPWTAKAPQLPKGGLSAAEEAGLDITPPPDEEASPGAMDLEAETFQAEAAQQGANDAANPELVTSIAQTGGEELVDWSAFEGGAPSWPQAAVPPQRLAQLDDPRNGLDSVSGYSTSEA